MDYRRINNFSLFYKAQKRVHKTFHPISDKTVIALNLVCQYGPIKVKRLMDQHGKINRSTGYLHTTKKLDKLIEAGYITNTQTGYIITTQGRDYLNTLELQLRKVRIDK